MNGLRLPVSIHSLVTAVLLAAVAVLFYRVHVLTDAYESEHPCVVIDWNDIANPANYGNDATTAKAAVDMAYDVADSFREAGYIVIDGRAVNSAPQEVIIGSARMKERMNLSGTGNTAGGE